MKINNDLLNEILFLNDVSAIDIILYLFNDFAHTGNKQLFNSIFFLKTIGKATSNNDYMTGKINTTLTKFIDTDRLNSNEVIFEFRYKYYDLFSDANLKKDYSNIDVSVVYNLRSLYSKKLYMFFEKNKFKAGDGLSYVEFKISEMKTALNISGYNLKGDFLRIFDRFFSDIKKIIPSYEFKISYKKQSRKIISLLCFFNEKPEVKINDFEVKTEFIPEKKEVENFTEVFMPTLKNEPETSKIENVINYQPEIKKEIVNEFKSVDNNNKELIEMDNDDINARFDAIEKAMNMKNIVTDPEVKENIKMSVPKEVVPKEEIKEEKKQEAKEENLSIPEQIYKLFITGYPFSENRFENMKVIFDSTNKKAIMTFPNQPFNSEWAKLNKADKCYQKAIALITNEVYKVEVK